MAVVCHMLVKYYVYGVANMIIIQRILSISLFMNLLTWWDNLQRCWQRWQAQDLNSSLKTVLLRVYFKMETLQL